MSIILNDHPYEIPGVTTLSWKDPEAASLGIKQVTDKTSRKTWIRGIVCHTTKGKEGPLVPGFGPKTDRALKYARYQTQTDRDVSWDYTCDFNGDWIVQNDPLKFYTWHAGNVNGYTCGFELVQDDTGKLYEGQIAKTVALIDFLTAKLGIQRQIPWDAKKDQPFRNTVSRIKGGGSDVVGIYSHSHQTTNRGFGDCGAWLPIALKNAGYLVFDFDSNEDKLFWKDKQKKLLGFTEAQSDGIPGPATLEALKTKGYKHGMIVSRPIDLLI